MFWHFASISAISYESLQWQISPGVTINAAESPMKVKVTVAEAGHWGRSWRRVMRAKQGIEGKDD